MSSISNVLIAQAMTSVRDFVLVGISRVQLVLSATIFILNWHRQLLPPLLFFEMLLIDKWLHFPSKYVVADAHRLFSRLAQKVGRRMSRATLGLS